MTTARMTTARMTTARMTTARMTTARMTTARMKALSAPGAPWVDTLVGVAAPWRVDRVELSVADARVDVHLAPPAGLRWPCPDCGAALPCHDHGAERIWRHLDMCEFRTMVHASLPRVRCPRHAVRDVAVPWADAGSAYTAAMQHCIIALAEHIGVPAAASALRIGWEDAWSLLMSRRVGV